MASGEDSKREERERDKDKDRDRDKERDRDKGRERKSDKKRAKEKGNRGRSSEYRRRRRSRSRSRSKSRSWSRSRSRSRDRNRSRRSRSRSSERRTRKKSRSKSKSKSRSRSRSRSHSRGRKSGQRSRSSSRERRRSRDDKEKVVSEDKKKASGWDNHGTVQTVETPTMGLATNPNVQIARTIQAAQQAALAMQCKVYVGSLDFELTEVDIRNAFTPCGIIKLVSLARDTSTGKSKGYCFIDFAYPEAAQLALESMNGKLLAGRPIKVGRPSHMMALPGILPSPNVAQCSAPLSLAIPPTLPRSVQPPSPSPRTIYIGSVHWDITEDEIKAIFQGFGTIKNCILMPNPETGKHKGYGFVEFESKDSADNALKYMNGFNIRGRPIKVGPAMMGAGLSGTNTTVSDAIKSAAQIASIARNGTINEESLSQEENLTISGSKDRFLVMQKLSRGEAALSRCMILHNMVTIDELDDELENEVSEECNKYGKVEKVVICKERLSGAVNDVVVKVYVVFGTAEEAQRATNVFNGRWFAGKEIKAEQTINPPFPV